MSKKKVIIIGGVAAGASAAARLRRLDEDVEIILLERGSYISYANCGLPYHIGEVIKERDALLITSPEKMTGEFKVDVRLNSEVVSINRGARTVTVRSGSKEYEESYDRLLITTGSSPIRPRIPGIDNEGIYTLWTIPEMDLIKSIVDEKKPRDAAVIGGGFIGIEMAENLAERGINVRLIEALDQIMAPFDPEMAAILHEQVEQNGVALKLGDGVASFEKEPDGRIRITTSSGKVYIEDIVILSVGIRPNGKLAADAGLTTNKRGAVTVDRTLRTDDEFIWAAGDVAETFSMATGERAMAPLAAPANKQGRIAADNIEASLKAEDIGTDPVFREYAGSISTSISKVFDLAAASTGINEKSLIQEGKIKGKDYYSVVISQKSHAGYYPLATPLYIKLIFTPDGLILGAQAIGSDGADKRIDTISALLGKHGTVEDLTELECAYAPPFNAAKDPVNMIGFTAENIMNGLVNLVSPDQVDKMAADGALMLDIRTDVERLVWTFPGDNTRHIVFAELRSRLSEIEDYRDKPIIVFCSVGQRSYNAARVLMNNGFKQVYTMEGGVSFYRSASYIPGSVEFDNTATAAEQNAAPVTSQTDASARIGGEMKILDCCGLQCPGPIMKVNQTMKDMADGDTLEVSATDMGFARDIESWCSRTGNTFVKTEKKGPMNVVTLRKGLGAAAEEADLPSAGAGAPAAQNAALPQGKTIIVFDGDMDKAMAAFIIANGAAAMGRPVTMFFTFWGLNILRKPKKVKVAKNVTEKMFGAMMPRGVDKLTISNMNMGGMGTAMMKKVMKDKNVSTLQELMQSALDAGVKIIACTMSMDVMGIRKEELIDGIEYAGVATYLGDAENSNVNLFI